MVALKEIWKVALIALGLAAFVGSVFGLLAGVFQLASWISGDNAFIAVPFVVLELIVIFAFGYACNGLLERWWNNRCHRKQM